MRRQHFESVGWNQSSRKNFGTSVGSQWWKGEERSELTKNRVDGKEKKMPFLCRWQREAHLASSGHSADTVSLIFLVRLTEAYTTQPAISILFEALYVLTDTGYVSRTLKIIYHQIQGWVDEEDTGKRTGKIREVCAMWGLDWLVSKQRRKPRAWAKKRMLDIAEHFLVSFEMPFQSRGGEDYDVRTQREAAHIDSPSGEHPERNQQTNPCH